MWRTEFPARRGCTLHSRTLKPVRRRGIDPITTERLYTPDEIEFMLAMQSFRERSLVAHPDVRDILRVVRDLGYVRREHGNVKA